MHFTLVGKYRWHSAFIGSRSSSNNPWHHHRLTDFSLQRLSYPVASEMEVRDETCCSDLHSDTDSCCRVADAGCLSWVTCMCCWNATWPVSRQYLQFTMLTYTCVHWQPVCTVSLYILVPVLYSLLESPRSIYSSDFCLTKNLCELTTYQRNAHKIIKEVEKLQKNQVKPPNTKTADAVRRHLSCGALSECFESMSNKC